MGMQQWELPADWQGGWEAAAAMVQQLQQQRWGRGSSSRSPSPPPASGILQPPWRPPGIASPPKSRSPSPERATPPRRTSFSLGYYGPDHDDDARLFLEPASASAGKKRRVAASGSQGSGGQQLNRSLALLAAADTPGGQRLQLPPSLIHEVLAYPSAKTVGLTGGKQGKAKARTGTEAAGGAGARQGQGRSREATLFSHPISPANNCGSDFAGHWEEDFRGGLTPAAAGRTQGYADIFGWPTMGASQSPGFSPAQVGVPSPQDSGN
mmetsp:Transcript_16863/g.46548  ORF Transcript_16863/g.46548 Transcript_16863/m.46548 type:complete len:267 (-) Transcript_16863:481-1281(-)